MVELLAPAGDKECFKAALSAGADAIYVGGKKYGARAYAGNFETDDLIECLNLAHLFDKKVYLTVNTLMKQPEIDDLVDFLMPLYKEGLDGVIVQDLGALKVMREAFPDMELHASTQMTVTGPYGANLLKEYGVSRVVPARELSLDEILTIKKETGLEIETFVHGAMCYGYSGQCLFSSMLGERSGNRGRCAGPCRLPYTAKYNGKRLNRDDEMYQLSLKDLCTLEVLPKLIDAGIDSFKIEGRMKTPEYVSFVTGMYRKYIDLYYKNPNTYAVSKEDTELLKNRFSRGTIQTGYYFMHNGRDLVTLDKPGYQSFATQETEVKKEELSGENKIDLIGHFTAYKDAPVCFTVYREGQPETTVVAFGENPSAAQKCPATHSDVQKQLSKVGNTCFSFAEITFDMEDDLFLPNKILNNLRRDAIAQLEDLILQKYRRETPDFRLNTVCESSKERTSEKKLIIEVRTLEQLEIISSFDNINRVCLDIDMFRPDSFDGLAASTEKLRSFGTEIYIKLPHVCRQKTIKIIEDKRFLIERIMPDGFCVGNLESLGFVKDQYPDIKIMSDCGLYVFNTETANVLIQHRITEHNVSYELHRKEIRQLANRVSGHDFFLPVYGYIPVMETAGCLLKTNKVCRNGNGAEQVILTDRQQKDRMVITHCDRCENTIYNSVPLSLHNETKHIEDLGISGIVLKFTFETEGQINSIVEFWSDMIQGIPASGYQVNEFTKGHFAKGVE